MGPRNSLAAALLEEGDGPMGLRHLRLSLQVATAAVLVVAD